MTIFFFYIRSVKIHFNYKNIDFQCHKRVLNNTFNFKNYICNQD